MASIEEIKEATMAGQAEKVKTLVAQAIADGTNLDDIVNKGFIAAMVIVGERFSKQEIYVPEMLVAARAMNMGLAILEPHIVGGERTYLGKILIGTVQGDLHDIGKNLVGMMLKGSGYEVIDLGVDVKAEKFVAAIKEHQPNIVGIAALLTTTMKFMKDTIDAVNEAGLRTQVKIIVGGAPVTARFAEEIGADRYVEDAGAAGEIVRQLVGAKQH